MKEVKFTLSIEEYTRLLEIVQELNKTSIAHKIKWLSEKILSYSLMAEVETGKINAVKAFIIDRTELFKQMPSNLNLSFVISDGKEWYKKFKFLVEEGESVEITLRYDEKSNAIYTFAAKNSILQITSIGGTDKVVKDMPMEFIKEKMNPNVSDWSVSISDDVFKKIKRISKLDSSDLLTLRTVDGAVSLKDDSWEMKIGDIDIEDTKLFFDKKYLDMVTVASELSIHVFGTYLLIKEESSLLLYNLSMFE
jgi:hypothetical protein